MFATRPRTPAVARLVRDDREQPRPECRVGAEAVEAAKRFDEPVLHRILGFVSRDPVREPQRGLAVTLDQHGERVDIALPGVDHQLLVAASIHRVPCIHRPGRSGSRRVPPRFTNP